VAPDYGIVIGNNVLFYAFIDGYSYLVGQDGQYLGEIVSNIYLANSIVNSYGTYGSEYSSTSINNEYSIYGSTYSRYSAYNSLAFTPPLIVYRALDGNVAIAYLTKNTILPYAIDPDLLKAYLTTH
jgi:hypothetical protein